MVRLQVATLGGHAMPEVWTIVTQCGWPLAICEVYRNEQEKPDPCKAA